MLMHGLLHIFSKKKVGKAVRKNIFVNKIVFFLVIFIFFMGGGGCAFPDSRDVISDTLFQNEKEDVTQSITIEDEIAEVPHVHKYNEDYVCTCGKVFYTEGLSYTFNEMGNYYIVDGIGTATGNELIIPKEYNGKPVEEIAIGAFKNLSHIKKLVIPSTIKRIGYDAFENMVHLTEIEYNAVSCEDCSSDGIFECAGLEGNGIELNIGEEVVRIPAYIFGANASPECFANIATVIFKGRNVIEVGVCAFGYCKNLASISIPEGTETIGSYAFAGCTGLKT